MEDRMEAAIAGMTLMVQGDITRLCAILNMSNRTLLNMYSTYNYAQILDIKSESKLHGHSLPA